MLRLVLFLLGVAAVATGLSWLADRPGSLIINWQGYDIETSVFRAVVILALLIGFFILLFSILMQIWRSPAAVGSLITRRRQNRGLEALSNGLIAIGAGDQTLATRYAVQARKALPNEPLTQLLRAQAATLTGDIATSRRIYEAMLGAPDTEQLGLRGLFLEAVKEGETEAARQFAERALDLNPRLEWPVNALFDMQCKEADWAGALETLAVAKRHGHVEKKLADRRRAVLLTAQAQAAEESEPDRALALSLEAHELAHDLIPAAAIAGRLLASKGSTPKAAKVIQRTWRRAPHPDLATAYAHARPGDSPRDRLNRIRDLARQAPHSIESPIALANTAIEAKEWDQARKALAPLLQDRLTQRVATLMARIEGEQHGDRGRVREWLARAVNAARDPAWTAEGYVSDKWAPVSPLTGELDAFQWRVPVENVDREDEAQRAVKREELVGLGTRAETMLEAPSRNAARAGADDADVVAAPEPLVRADEAAPRPTSRPAEPHAGERRPATLDPVAVAREPEAAAKPAAMRPPVREAAAVTVAPAKPQPPAPAAPAARAAAADAVVIALAASSPAKSSPPPRASDGGGDGVAASRAAGDATRETRRIEPAAVTRGQAPTTEATQRGARQQTHKPQIYVAPRAPDDPGPDREEEGRAELVRHLKGRH